MEFIDYNGWKCIRLTNGKVELVVTRDIGPRIIRYGFVGGPNLLGEIPADKGGRGEKEWHNRGGHRLWIAPEANPWSYEPDNEPYASAEAIPNGVRTRQLPGPITHVEKQMDITLDMATGGVKIDHRLTNRGDAPVRLAPWAVTVVGLGGTAIIPLPKKVPHTECLVPVQKVALWSYTDFADPRWTFGSDYIFFRQDPAIAKPQKIGLRTSEGWVAYQRENLLFFKKFGELPGAEYPDMDVNFETFTNHEILELEALGPMATLAPGESVSMPEEWKLYADFPPCATEADVTARVRPLA